MKWPLLTFLKIAWLISITAALLREEQEVSSVNYRRKSSNKKTTAQTSSVGNFFGKNEWTKRKECYVDDSADECRLLENGTTCFGAPIPFALSSTKHLETLDWQSPIGEYLERYGAFDGLPECWRYLRELLCAAIYPPCESGLVLRIPKALCVETRKKCGFLIENDLWPSAFGNCSYSNETTTSDGLDSILSKNCKVTRNVVWPEDDACLHPFALTVYEPGWIVDHCSLNCTSFRIEQSHPIRILLTIGLGLIWIFTFVTAMLLFNEDNLNKTWRHYYWSLRWYSVSQLILAACWILQMVSNADIICREDGSIRLQEPSSSGVWCVFQNLVLLTSSLAATFWTTSFSWRYYKWLKTRGHCSKKSSHHHVAVVGLAILFLTLSVALTAIEGDPVLSVCFVSKNWRGIICYVVPIAISSAFTVTFFAMACWVRKNCCKFGKNNQGEDEVLRKGGVEEKLVHPSIAQIGVLLLILLALHLASAALFCLDTLQSGNDRQRLLEYVKCKLHESKEVDKSSCQYQDDLDTRLAQCRIILMCLPALVVDVWVLLCGRLGKGFTRIFKFTKCKKWTTANGGVVTTEMTPMPTIASDQASDVSGRYLANRLSLQWLSASTLPGEDRGAVSEPDCHNWRRKAAFYDKMKLQRRDLRHRHRSGSATPYSLKSAPLPPDVPPSGSSQNTLPFPELSRYPVVPDSTPKNNWWASYGWPYPGWPPYPYCYHQQPYSSASTAPVNWVWPPTSTPAISDATPREQREPTKADDSAGAPSTAQDPAQSSTDKTKQSGASPASATTISPGCVQYYWPAPYSPYPPYPYPPYHPPHVHPTSPVTIRPVETSPSSTASAKNVIASGSKAPEKEETAAKENLTKDSSKKPEALCKKVEEARDDDDEEENEDEEEVDSEEVDSDEEQFVQEQLKSLLGTK